MKIAVFAAYYNPHVGGFEKNVHELAKRLVTKGHEVCVFTCNTNRVPVKEFVDGVKVERLPCLHLLNNSYPVPLRWWGFGHHDIVITQTRFFVSSLQGFVYSILHRVPLIHVERGSRHTELSNKLVAWLGKVYDHTIGRMIVRRAVANVGISSAACKFVEHLGSTNVHLIYNGIAKFDGKLAPFTQPRIITYVGRLIYAKGVQDLMTAFESQSEQTALWIVGAGNYRSELEDYAKRLKRGSAIRFVGQRSQGDVMAILSVSSVFVNPSYSEGLPTGVMEAASVGLPIIATDVGGTREILTDMVSGSIIQPHDVDEMARMMRMFLAAPPLAFAMGDAAKEAVRLKFDWEEITLQWMLLLNSVLREHLGYKPAVWEPVQYRQGGTWREVK